MPEYVTEFAPSLRGKGKGKGIGVGIGIERIEFAKPYRIGYVLFFSTSFTTTPEIYKKLTFFFPTRLTTNQCVVYAY